jgi:hypothetical protein
MLARIEGQNGHPAGYKRPDAGELDRAQRIRPDIILGQVTIPERSATPSLPSPLPRRPFVEPG